LFPHIPWEHCWNDKKNFILGRIIMSDRKMIGIFSYQRIKIHALAAIAILLIYPALIKAADNDWNVAAGDWSDTNPIPWTLGAEPSSSDKAYVQNGGTVSITQDGEQCSYLYVGAANSGTIKMTGGSLSVSNFSYIGSSGTGTFEQSGGDNSILQTLSLGRFSGASGTYKLSGTGILSSVDEYIGASGTGTFSQDGGTNSVSTTLFIGANFHGIGKYDLSGTGQLSV
jgi:hypothetical protein